MDERDLPKALLSLLHIVNGSVGIGDGGSDGWTGRGLGNGVEEEVEWQNVVFISPQVNGWMAMDGHCIEIVSTKVCQKAKTINTGRNWCSSRRVHVRGQL